jgi:alcohol dehydrogenase
VHHAIDPTDGEAVNKIKSITDGKGCDAVIEAVGIPATFELCQELVAPGGVIANVGVHGTKVDLHLEKLWAQNICTFPALIYLLLFLSGHCFNCWKKKQLQRALSILSRRRCC